MPVVDPRQRAAYRVRVVGNDVAYTRVLTEALLDVPAATDEELTRLVVDTETPLEEADAHVAVVPIDTTRLEATHRPVFRVRCDVASPREIPPLDGRSFVVGPNLEGIELLRAALLSEALVHVGATVDRVRRAKRPFAIAIIASATLASAVEGVFPGAAAFVLTTQVGAVTSLYYLYQGKWISRKQVLTMLPGFLREASGGSFFLLAKSFFPPTGVADLAAAVVAASMTVAMLGAVAVVLEQGYTLDERERLNVAFQRLRAKTRAERATISRNHKLWTTKTFFRDLVRRIVFE
jgi:hypothetical protein